MKSSWGAYHHSKLSITVSLSIKAFTLPITFWETAASLTVWTRKIWKFHNQCQPNFLPGESLRLLPKNWVYKREKWLESEIRLVISFPHYKIYTDFNFWKLVPSEMTPISALTLLELSYLKSCGNKSLTFVFIILLTLAEEGHKETSIPSNKPF